MHLLFKSQYFLASIWTTGYASFLVGMRLQSHAYTATCMCGHYLESMSSLEDVEYSHFHGPLIKLMMMTDLTCLCSRERSHK